MANPHKLVYMKSYNQRLDVKAKKAEYMRRARSQKDQESSRNLVHTLLDLGFESLALEYAQERAPEMLAMIKAPVRRRSS